MTDTFDPHDVYPSDLDDDDDRADIEETDRRADSGEHDDPSAETCSFRSVDTDPGSAPCPHHVTGSVTLEEVPFPACTFHRARGGILHALARRRLVLDLAARGHIETNTSAVTDEGDRVTFPSFCSKCGARLFAGNTSTFCYDCATDAALEALNGGPDGPILELSPAELVAEEQADVDAARAAGYFDAAWPAPALAAPPAFPFRMDRPTFESPRMAGWRARLGLGR